MVAVITEGCLNEGLSLLCTCSEKISVKIETVSAEGDCTFVVLVTASGVSTSAARHPAWRKRNKGVKRVRHLREINARLLMSPSPQHFPDTPTAHMSASTGPASPEAAHACRAACLCV